MAETAPSRKYLVRVLFFLNAAAWFGYVVYIYYDMAVLNKNLHSADIVTLFVFVNAVAMLLSGLQLGKSEKWVYYFALVVVGANTLLTALNILDLFFLGIFLLDLFILLSLIPIRKSYLSSS
jgi:hypothetical protein